jgi:hypothetical protein
VDKLDLLDSKPRRRCNTTIIEGTRSSSRLIPRRRILRVGGGGLIGLTLPRLLRAQAGGARPRADALIVLFLNGGPSHLDMWDLKPDAPAEIRGPFQPIPSSLDGVQLCEHLPRLARQMHRAALVRSIHHSVNNSHAAAVYTALTGHDDGERGGGFKATDHPPPGSVLAMRRPSERTVVPYVALPYKTQEGAGGPLQPGFLAGFLGHRHDPFWVLEDPNVEGFRVPNLTPAGGLSSDRLTSRSGLLRRLNVRPVGWPAEPGLDSMDDFQRRAFELLTSDGARRAFEIEREPAALREAYGRNIYGQSTLLARRLVEAGTRAVTLSWAPDANATWDTHGDNFNKLKDVLLPPFDAAAASLIADLADRGMLDRTLVAVLGDFGRTPKINANAGRDHWNSCYTILLAGGGLKAGVVHGSSDRIGALPARDPVTPGDIIATIYHLMGVDPRSEIHDALGRPFEIVREGKVVQPLLA